MNAMRVRRRLTRSRRWWMFAIVMVAACGSAGAFDTGHHIDLTEAVLREDRFGDPATQVVEVTNWFTDYFAVSPLSRPEVSANLLKLHFDNLYSTEAVARYWGWLMHNAKEATLEAARADDPLAMLAVTGLMLHAVQDFHAHSNWAELHDVATPAPFSRETWFTSGPPAGVKVFTGSYPPYPSPPPPGHPEHGDYNSGLNKDSHTRPLWAEAYVAAYCTTEEVLGALRTWAEEARPGFWRKAKEIQFDGPEQQRIDRAVEAARVLSMAVEGKGAKGHWKGPESGSARYLSTFGVEWTSSKPSLVEQLVKNGSVQQRLAFNLYSANAPPWLAPIKSFDGDRNIVEVKITYVAEQRGGGRRIDRGRNADLFAVTTVGAQRYVDRVLRGQKSHADPWTTIHVAGAGEAEIPVRLEVWDQDEILGRKDEQCDINPVAGRKELTFTVRVTDDHLQGDLSGLYTGPERPFEIGGAAPDGLGVVVRGFVRTRRLAPSPPRLP